MMDDNQNFPNPEEPPTENSNPILDENRNAGEQPPQNQPSQTIPAWHIQPPYAPQPPVGNWQTPNPYQYPYPYPNAYYIPPVDPVTQEKRNIFKTANGIGGMLLVKIGVEFVLSIILIAIVCVCLFVVNKSHYDFSSSESVNRFMNDALSYFTGSSLITRLINIFLYICVLGLPILFYKFFSHRKFSELFPLGVSVPSESEGQLKKKFTKNVGDFAPALFICMGAAFIGEMFSNLVENGLHSIHLQSKPLPFDAPTDLVGFVAFFIAVAILPAFFEEFMFRGVILQSLRKYGDGFAILISAALFGLMHGNITQIPYAFIIGLIIGYFVVKQGSLWIGIFIHFFNNGIGTIVSLISQKLGSQYDIVINYSYGLIVLLLAIISLIYLITKNKDLFRFPQKEVSSVKLAAGSAGKAFILTPTIIIFLVYIAFSCALFLEVMPL